MMYLEILYIQAKFSEGILCIGRETAYQNNIGTRI